MSAPVIVVAVDDERLRDALVANLGPRFSPHYEVICGPSRWATARLKSLADEGRDVALVMAATDLPDLGIGGVELLAKVRRRHPRARRQLLVDRGEWRGHPIREAMILGLVDSYVFVPWGQRERWLFLPVTEALADWERSRPPEEVAVTVVGESAARRSYELRDIFSRAAIPFIFVDPESADGAALLAEDGGVSSAQRLPLLLMASGARLADPTDAQIVEQLGFLSEPPDRVYDVAVVGAGPSGLSAAVYATSEGLSTVLVSPGVPGGQAGTSSMIRNYLGFPRGLAGVELTTRAFEQAWLFGTEMVLADTVVGIAPDGDHRLVTTSRGRLRARAVVLATGVDWRRLEVPSLEAFFGVGVFYGAAVSEADAMTGRQVVVVGGGNSAGQAAIHLNKRAGGVTVAVRGPSLAETMSDYLIREIDASPTITLRHNTEVVDATGRGRLERLILRDNRTGSTETLAADALFVMIGAEPRTDWLGEVVARDTAGYLLTGPDVPAAAWPLERPPLFLETSLPGVFAVGDVQHGSTKRVATSVGSGAMAIRLVHQYLAETADRPEETSSR